MRETSGRTQALRMLNGSTGRTQALRMLNGSTGRTQALRILNTTMIMRAVILEKVNNEYIVLAEDESMHTIPCAPGTEIGDIVNIDTRRQWSTASRRIAQRAAACAAVLLIAFAGLFSYMTFDVSAAVTTDGDASIVYYINHRNQVLKAEALNDAGAEVLDAMGGISRRPKLDDVLKKTEGIMQDKGYLEEDESLTYEIDKSVGKNAGSGESSKPADKDTNASGSGNSGGSNAEKSSGSSSQEKPEEVAGQPNNTDASGRRELPAGNKDNTSGRDSTKDDKNQGGVRGGDQDNTGSEKDQIDKSGGHGGQNGSGGKAPYDETGDGGNGRAPDGDSDIGNNTGSGKDDTGSGGAETGSNSGGGKNDTGGGSAPDGGSGESSPDGGTSGS